MNANLCLLLIVVGWSIGGTVSSADEFELHRFESIQLTDTYYSEGANVGDVNRDGVMDVVHGPYWFEGPSYKTKHEIYRPLAQPRQKYADNFFSWVYDFNGDGWNDIFVVGFPGTPAHVYENPAQSGFDAHWTKHEVFDWVSNESPQLANLVGDERPELVCTRDGYFGYATIDWQNPLQKWTFHAVSEQTAPKHFGHGLGIGDVDGDGRLDIINRQGWFEQPESLQGDRQWAFHPVAFAAAGGAEMYAYDVDGDGDNDIITSLAAHDFGLAWFEQVEEGGKITFLKHLIMGRMPEDNRYGVVFTELHTVNLADMDGDGLKDIVTGKTYWSHHTQSAMWDAGAVVYWFKLVRNEDGIDWIPYQINGETGVGRQVIVADVNADQLPDVVVGGMKGAHVLIHEKKAVDQQAWYAQQPQPLVQLKSGLSPQQAAEHMTTLAGFRVRLAAGEPQVHQPIGFTIDERGRLWVAEAYNYPLRAAEGQGQDKIVILEDTDQDGSFDSRKVFIEGLNLVSGLEVGMGGVWVGAAPYLLFIPDQNGDDVPDAEPQILLDGFGYQDTHETLNAFIWGPDGWLYGCHGVFTHSRVGRPGTPNHQRTPMNAGVWRYHPIGQQFEVFAWGTSNPWGVDFNDYGQAFMTACVIPHLWHVIQGARYHRQGGTHFNPYLYDDLKTIADHSHFVGDINDHAWWGHEPQAPPDTLRAGGGHAHCGAMVYLGDNWPDQYRNQIFMNNVHGNRVNVDLLERRDSGYVGRHGNDILLANDQWYRGVNLKYGPDGSVYLIDWYDRNACHRTDPTIWDRTNGRIFNLAYGEVQPVSVDIGKLDDSQLVELQLHRNDWYVRTSRRLLQQRAAYGQLGAETAAALIKIFHDHPDLTRKLRALWTLHVIDGLSDDFKIELLQHPNELVRAWAIQLELEDKRANESFVSVMAGMAKTDPSPVVRLYLASASMRLPKLQRWPIVEALAGHGEDAADHNLPLMYWYAIEPLVTEDVGRALALAKTAQIPLLTQFIVRRAAADNHALETVVASIAQADDPRFQLLYLDEMLRAFEGRANIPIPDTWAEAYESIGAAIDNPEVRERADQVAVVLGDQRVYPKFRELLVDQQAPMEKRKQALDILVRGRDKAAANSYQQVLNEPALRGSAIRALSSLDDTRTPEAILGLYSQLTENEKRDAIATLVSRPSYAERLLDSIDAGKIPGTDLHAYHVRQLLQFDDQSLAKRINEVWGEVREASADNQAAIARYKSVLNPAALAKADLANGRRVFDATCASCHLLFGEGGKVGPDITGSNRGNLEYLLENLLDPSAVLGNDYRMTIVQTLDGRFISGLIQKETDSAVTLRTINDTVVVAKEDIDERRISNLSVMPERQLDQLKPDEVLDLIAYLGSPAQVAPRGPRAPIDPKTNRVPGAIEGESMGIVGKSAGKASSQKMGGFAKDRWSGDDHLWWTGGKPGETLELELDVETPGSYDVEIVLTKARDYGVVQLSLDGKSLGNSIDLYNAPDVITTGVLTFPDRKLEKGKHQLQVQIVGAHPQAIKVFMFGLDYVRLVPSVSEN